MKKLLICLFLGSAFSLNIAGDNGTTMTTYYGAKASSSANNPCKGATIRVCGTIETKNTIIYLTIIDKLVIYVLPYYLIFFVPNLLNG